ncbi:MAG: pilin [Gammaproteobacteria bacterium]|jgi:type IV pilus assembly protein PilA
MLERFSKMSVLGFTIIELLITLAIIAVIAVIAIPSYMNYTRRSYYSKIVQAAAPYKLGVSECYHTTGALTNCDAGSNGVPAARTTADGAIGSITVSNGVITVTPVAAHGIKTLDTYILTPTVNNNILTWTTSGPGVDAGYAR